MAIIVHHNDDDGLCAGAIAYRQLVNMFDPRKICYEYSHHKRPEIDFESVREGEDVFIVDLSLDEFIIDIIKKFVEKGAKVTWIDHHKTSVNALESLSEEDKAIMDKVTKFVRIGISGALLTYLFASMSDDEKEHIDDMYDKFDFTEGRTHFAFFKNGTQSLDHIIPQGIRWIDDFDIWKHEFEETKFFNLGFSMEKDKRPSNDKVWDRIINSNTSDNIRLLYEKYVEPGRIIYEYQEACNHKSMSRSFEAEIGGIKCLCVNATGNSFVFGDKIHEYPMCCLFYHTGNNWHYSLYSSESSEIAVDVSKVAESLGGGGHERSSGFVTQKLIFDT